MNAQMMERSHEIETFLASGEAVRGWSDNTMDSYLRCLSKLIDFLHERKDGYWQWRDVKLHDLRAFLMARIEHGVGSRTVNHHRACLRSFWTHLVKYEIVDENIAERLVTRQTGKKLANFLMEPEMAIALAAAHGRARSGTFQDLRDMALLETAYSTGTRVEELTTLAPADVQFDRGVVRVRGKGDKERLVPLTDGAAKALKRYLDARKRLSAGADPDRLWVSKRGKAIGRRQVQTILSPPLFRGSEGRVGNAHAIRHSAATHLSNVGVGYLPIQRMLGHSSVDVTAEYIHVATETLQAMHNANHPSTPDVG